LTGDSAAMIDPRLTDSATRSLVDGLVLLDIKARVAFWNPRAEEFLRWSASEMLGLVADDLVQRIAWRATQDTVQSKLHDALMARDPSVSVELEIRQSGSDVEPHNGNRIIAARFFSLCDASGSDIGTGLVLRDVTQERTADAMKSQLLSTVSHELRTPLASIKGFATTLLRQDVRWDEATQRDFLKIIEEESDRLTEIIDNLLDMSQLEAGALRIVKEPVQLRQLIREVVDEMRMRTESHYFVVDLPSEMPQVMADQRRIRQVLTNLIGNAIKYTKRGQIAVSCEIEDDHMTVSVSDQGDGIPPQYLDRIFERFFQVDGASTRRVGGSGLGLSISRGIIQAHNGRMWAESVLGQGSLFRFALPLAGDEAAE
jgi:signal transduction histidine kinase